MAIRHTLCWECAKACGRCSWSDYWEHRPVPGWTAEKTKVRMNNKSFADAYIVIDCPEFERDGLGGGLYRMMEVKNDGVRNVQRDSGRRRRF